MKQLIILLITALANAIRTPREEVEALRKQNEDLQQRLRDEDLEDAELEELTPQINEVLALAAAARPPSQDQIDATRSSLEGGNGVTQDPAQPAGSPAPGDPEVEKRAAELKKEREGQIQTLVNENSHKQLLEKAEEAGVQVGSHATKNEIAEAIVNSQSKENSGNERENDSNPDGNPDGNSQD